MDNLLLPSSPFQGLSEEELSGLLKKVNFRVKRYRKGEVIALRGDPCNNLLIIKRGSVKGEMLDFSGKTLKIEDIEAPRAIASAFLFGQNNKFPVDVIGSEEGELLILPKASVIHLFKESQVFLKNYLDSISNRAQFLSTRLYFLSFKTIKGKLAQYILSLSKPGDRELLLPKTQQEMAEFFGVTRPALARVMSELVKDRIVQVKRRRVLITDREKLMRLVR